MHARLILAFLLAAFLAGCSASHRQGDVSDWIARNAQPLRDIETDCSSDLHRHFDRARVVALGEATHGQHESFEAKRAVTMHLIRRHGYRIVAYEASASKAMACDAYVSGESDDLNAAMRGLGMMIWSIEENAALLRELRDWNQRATPAQRVRFVGIDVQDADASSSRLAALLKERWPDDAATVQSIAQRLDPSVQKMFTGDREEYDDLVRETITTLERVRERVAQAAMTDEARSKIGSAVLEFEGSVHMYLTSGRRDRAMADMTLRTLEDSGPESKIVLWAHNAHVTRGAMRYVGAEELAMGGHLNASLQDRYLPIGFAFGSGEFVANDQESGKWIFRTYGVDAPPEGSLEYPFHARLQEPSVLNLRRESGDPVVEEWKRTDHGQRWYGGYRVPADVREIARDVIKLMATRPGEEFDAIIYLPRTTGSTPRE